MATKVREKIEPRFTKKEKIIFWLALAFGIAGGVIGDFLVSYFFRYVEYENSIDALGTLAFLLLFLSFIYYCIKQAKKNLT